MQKLNKLKCKLSLILLLSLTSCAIKPPDVAVFEELSSYLGKDETTGHIVLKPSPACMEHIKESDCGHGVYIVSKKEIFIGENTLFNGKKWSEIKKTSILLPAVESYTPIVTYMINACKKTNCDKEVDEYRVKIKSLKVVNDTENNLQNDRTDPQEQASRNFLNSKE